MGALAGKLLGSVGSLFGSYWVWLIVIAVVAAGAFGLGYERATSLAENKLVSAQMEMYAKGVTAQKNFDDGQFKVSSADFARRHAADVKRLKNLQTILDNLPVLVPRQDACSISPEAMKKLNEVVNEAP